MLGEASLAQTWIMIPHSCTDLTALPHIAGYTVLEQLYVGSRTGVYRAIAQVSQQPVIIKILQQDYPSCQDLVQFRNQFTITKNLTIPGIVRPLSLEPYGNSYALVMDDWGGNSLRQFIQKHTLSLDGIVEIVLQIADILHDLHQAQIIHKDIKPANILIHPVTQQVKLIDFSIASLLPKENQEIKNSRGLEGTLAYLAPEQTGRMNRGVDFRTDFYALGVTFFELLVGQLPFQSNDPMELIHCHLTKSPPKLEKLSLPGQDCKVPQALADIVLKLMAKNAEDRYQSAIGLKYDLQICLDCLQESGTIQPFKLATHDLCDHFLIPEKLYGREAEVQVLLDAFDRVASPVDNRPFNNTPELILVAGFSGIGKTAVVNEVQKPIVRQRGYFIKGKFDQFNRNVPFSAFVQAFRDLINQLLSESRTQLEHWKKLLLRALGDSAQVIIELIPELDRILGPQLPAPELSGSAAQHRFNLLFQKFVQVFTTPDHPLVIFLDDLQWVDFASFKLIQLLIEESRSGYLLMIGAYRDNEVFPAHPLMLTLDEVQKTGATINTITLKPLTALSLNQLVADTLDCPIVTAQPLAELVYQKTEGNPFFATQFLKRLHQDSLITLNTQAGHWECDLTQIRTAALTNNVVELMAQQIQKLPAETQTVLTLAACIGNQFDLQTLSIVAEQSATEVAAVLWPALQEGLILPKNELYKLYLNHQVTEATNHSGNNARYRFLHDRIQQAAYSLIPDTQKQLTHLTIGQLLLQHFDADHQDEYFFEILNHLNCGISLITSTSQRQQYAQLNFRAAHKAKESTAYNAALHYLDYGMQLLSPDSWQVDYELTRNIYELAAEVALLNCNFEQMDLWIQIVLQNTCTLLDQVKVYEVKLQAHQVQNQQLQAITIGREILKKLGVNLPEFVTPLDIQQQIQRTLDTVSNYEIETLVDLPITQDEAVIAAARIMTSLVPSVHQANPALFPILACEEVNLALKYGNSLFSAPGYADFGIIISSISNQLETGYRFGQLALNLIERFAEKSVQSMVQFKVAAFNHSNQQSIHQAIALLKESYNVAIETGDSVHALVSTSFRLFYTYLSGTEDLDLILEEIHTYQSRFSTSQHFLTWVQILCSSIHHLTCSSGNYNYLSSDSEQQQLSILLQENDELSLHLFYLSKLILSCLFGNFDNAIHSAEQCSKYLKAGVGMPSAPTYYYYDSLTRLMLSSHCDSVQQAQFLSQVESNQENLLLYANAAPMNYQHKYHLVEAVRCDVLGIQSDALDLFDRAIAGAKEHGFTQDEALANELASKFYLNWGKDKIAAVYLQEAYYCYARWGATAKTDQLEKNYPHLLRPILQTTPQPFNISETFATINSPNLTLHSSTNPHRSSNTDINTVLDFAAIIKASQSLSESLQIDDLLHQLTQIILQNSGGERCALILPNHINEWHIAAIATPETTELCSQPLEGNLNVPVKLIQYVQNTQEMVVINDLKTNLPVIDDYLQERQPKSLLCLPILNQGQLIGILYLKNRSTSGVFTSNRIVLLNFLCTQAAISLANANLYQASQTYAQQLEDSLKKLRVNEGRFQKLANNVPGLIYQIQVQADGTVSVPYVSSGCHALYEVAAEDLMTGKVTLRDFEHPEDQAGILQAMVESAQNLTPFRHEWRIITPKGTVKWIKAASQPERGEQGEIIWDGILIDITDRQQAEAAVIQKSQELQQVLTDLQDTQLQMVQNEKMASLGNLVAGIAHEINNPIGFLNGSINNAKDYVKDLLDHVHLYQQHYTNADRAIQEHAEDIDLEFIQEDLQKLLNSMQGANDRIKSISTSLRTFSRADTEYKVSANLHEGIDSTLLILKYRLKANERRPAIQVIHDYGNLPPVECFPGQLNQVFMNILANAIDLFDEMAQTQTFEKLVANPQQITIRTEVIDHCIQIGIRDNGWGMTEVVKARIFDHLFTTKSVGKGTGLGLAIAQQIIVEKHQGRIEVQSEIGKGTEFLIQLPISTK
ncbi:trifunctional serine/threonine-protein kinase/ATP-binding protein/sensor histidine kinase [Alkalinema pantanalense CENA528]|uniref:trifunctional serine/threonine-protein kinase/ATP-binding protein/sensor histidine kinase n=1 Tax=Alkalinema pantanalense TaxID=1620705 RepID=UPI003D6FBD57